MIRPLALACLFVLTPALHADDVYLRNGETFEGVATEAGEHAVTIHLRAGLLRIPRSEIDRIEPGVSVVSEWRDRYRALAASPAADASDWLALARWAEIHDLPQAARQAAQQAARLDPELEALAPLLRRLGLARSAEPPTSAAEAEASKVRAPARDAVEILAEALERRDAQVDKMLDVVAEQALRENVQTIVVLPPQPTVLAAGVGFYPSRPGPGERRQPQYRSPYAASLGGIWFRGPFAVGQTSWEGLALHQPGSFIPPSSGGRR